MGKKNKSISSIIKEQEEKRERDVNNKNNHIHPNLSNKKCCRICFGEEKDSNNTSPLINPCHCNGGLKYIHLSCLQHWLNIKKAEKYNYDQNCITYYYKRKDCELCKCSLPDIVHSNNTYYEIWNFDEIPFENYIVFESVKNIITNSIEYKTFHILNIEGKDMRTIGRSHEVDLRIKDGSVSRIHATIKLIKGSDPKVVLFDNQSKFGTIVLMQSDSLPIWNRPMLSLQFGKILVWVNMSRSVVYRCGSCREKKKKGDYNKVNSESINMMKSFVIKEEEDQKDEREDCEVKEEEEKEEEGEGDKEEETIERVNEINEVNYDNNGNWTDKEEDLEINEVNDINFDFKGRKDEYFIPKNKK